jgi:hypothetical protein
MTHGPAELTAKRGEVAASSKALSTAMDGLWGRSQYLAHEASKARTLPGEMQGSTSHDKVDRQSQTYAGKLLQAMTSPGVQRYQLSNLHSKRLEGPRRRCFFYRCSTVATNPAERPPHQKWINACQRSAVVKLPNHTASTEQNWGTKIIYNILGIPWSLL